MTTRRAGRLRHLVERLFTSQAEVLQCSVYLGGSLLGHLTPETLGETNNKIILPYPPPYPLYFLLTVLPFFFIDRQASQRRGDAQLCKF